MLNRLKKLVFPVISSLLMTLPLLSSPAKAAGREFYVSPEAIQAVRDRVPYTAINETPAEIISKSLNDRCKQLERGMTSNQLWAGDVEHIVRGDYKHKYYLLSVFEAIDKVAPEKVCPEYDK